MRWLHLISRKKRQRHVVLLGFLVTLNGWTNIQKRTQNFPSRYSFIQCDRMYWLLTTVFFLFDVVIIYLWNVIIIICLVLIELNDLSGPNAWSNRANNDMISFYLKFDSLCLLTFLRQSLSFLFSIPKDFKDYLNLTWSDRLTNNEL